MEFHQWLSETYGPSIGIPTSVKAPTNPHTDGIYTQPPCTQVSPSVIPPISSSLSNMDEDYLAGIPASQISLPDTIDLALYETVPEMDVVVVPKHLSETISKILVQLTAIWDYSVFSNPEEVAEAGYDPTNLPMFTAEELKAHESDLTPIPEDESNPFPTTIDDLRVNTKPKARDIKTILKDRRTGKPGISQRRIFYLAETKTGEYYWFAPPRSHRGKRMNKLIRDFRYKEGKKKYSEKKMKGKHGSK